MKRLLLIGLSALLACFIAGCSGGGGASGKTLEVHGLLNGQLHNAVWAAFQDGDSAWQTIRPSSTGIYRAVVNDPGGRYGFAVARPGTGFTTVQIVQATLAELPRFGITATADVPATVTLNGNFSGAQLGEVMADVDVGNTGTVFTNLAGPADSRPYAFNLPPATYDLGATLYDATETPTRLYLNRGLQLNGPITYNIDAGETHAFPADLSHRITVTGDAPNWAYTALRTANGTWMTVGSPPTNGNPAQFSYTGLPDALVDPGDAFEANAALSGTNTVRMQQVYYRTAADKTLMLPPALGAATVDPGGGGPYLRPQVTLTPVDGAVYYQLDYLSEGSAGADLEWDLTLSGGWIGGATSYRLPDFAWLGGWQPAWGLQQLDWWQLAATTSNKTLRQIIALFTPAEPLTQDTVISYSAQSQSLTSKSRGMAPASKRPPSWSPPLTPP